jgi:hypothetical protein
MTDGSTPRPASVPPCFEKARPRRRLSSARRKYASIFCPFGDRLADELGRPLVVVDLDTDKIAAYGPYLAAGGGRGGRPAGPSRFARGFWSLRLIRAVSMCVATS